VAELLAPVHESVARLTTIPGVSHLVAHVLVAEVGLGTTRFPSPAHLRSWAGLCPRLDESTGKRRSTRLRLGAPWLKTTLVQAAWAAVKVKQSYFRAQFLRRPARRHHPVRNSGHPERLVPGRCPGAMHGTSSPTSGSTSSTRR
jgi:transposase